MGRKLQMTGSEYMYLSKEQMCSWSFHGEV